MQSNWRRAALFLLAIAIWAPSFAGLAVTSRGLVRADDQARKIVRFRQGEEQPAYGLVDGDAIRVLEGRFADWKPTDKTVPLADVRVLVPVARPTKVLALAGNYRDHLGSRPAPKYPEPFLKTPSSLQRDGGPVVLPNDTEEVHYEAEVVIVMGKRCKNVSEAEAMDYVLGITCGNDISARIWQNGNDETQKDVQWWRAKGADTFSPCGPYIVSGIDYGNLQMTLRVNGEVRQQTNTKNMIHNLAETVSYISKYMTLEPGDLIYTGTPGRTQALKAGDTVEVEIEKVGVLRNPVVQQRGRSAQ